MSSGLTTAAGILFVLEFLIVLILPVALIGSFMGFFSMIPGFGALMALFIVILVLVQALLYHWTLVFGLLCIRWRGFPEENKSALLAFGIVGIILSVAIALIGGWVDWIGSAMGIIASILAIVASTTAD